jgi:hypothetical protein
MYDIFKILSADQRLSCHWPEVRMQNFEMDFFVRVPFGGKNQLYISFQKRFPAFNKMVNHRQPPPQLSKELLTAPGFCAKTS